MKPHQIALIVRIVPMIALAQMKEIDDCSSVLKDELVGIPRGEGDSRELSVLITKVTAQHLLPLTMKATMIRLIP